MQYKKMQGKRDCKMTEIVTVSAAFLAKLNKQIFVKKPKTENAKTIPF